MNEPETISVNNVEYVRKDAQPPPNGKRAVVVVDRGWIFAGDVAEENGRIRLSRAVLVFNWSQIGFDGVLRNPRSEKVNIRKLSHDVDLPCDAEVFRIPVADNWGLFSYSSS